MKYLLLSALLLCTANLFAQAPQKQTVIVDKFKIAGNISKANSEAIRGGVITGLIQKGRMHIVDATTNEQLKKLSEGKNGEEGVTMENVLEEAKDVFKAMNATYIISGTTINYNSKRETKSSGDKSYTKYTATFTYNLSGYNITEGTVVASKSFEASGTGETEGDAINAAVKYVYMDMSRYVNEFFSFSTYILQLEEVKKDKLKELYIHCGAAIGVKKGDLFEVVQEISIAGVKSKKEIGRLRVVEVSGDELSKCTVTRGNAEILKMFKDADNDPAKVREKMIVISGGESLLGGIF